MSLVVNGGLGFVATHAGMQEEARPIAMSIGIGLLGEAVAVGLRGMSNGVPFSPEGRDDRHRLPRRAEFTPLARQPMLRDWLRR